MSEYIAEALITGFFALIVGVIGFFAGRKKNDGDAAQSISNAASKAVENLLKPLTDRVAVLEDKVKKQDLKLERYGQRVIVLMRGIEQLMTQITRLGHVPEWIPGDWSPDEDEDG